MKLRKCQKYCLVNKRCTAIRFNEQHNTHHSCVLQKCPLPVPEPEEASRKYTGYFITSGIDKAHK